MNFGTSKKIVLDLYQNKYVATNAAQYDIDSRELIVQITDEGKPYYVDGKTVKVVIEYKKSDGHNVINDCTVLEDGTVSVELTEQMLITGGRCEAELMLLNIQTNQAIHTMTFIVNTKNSVITNENLESTNEFKTLERALLQVEDVAKYADSARESAEMAEIYENAALQAKNNAESIISQIEDISSYVDDTKKYANEALASKDTIITYEQASLEAKNKTLQYEEDALGLKNNMETYLQDVSEASNAIQGYIDSANESVSDANTMIANLNKTIVEIETNETERNQKETERQSAEDERNDAEAIRIANETVRQSQENQRQTDTATAIANADKATDRANIAAESCEGIIGGTGLIASTEKGRADGVASLDANAKIPMEQLSDNVVTQAELDAAYANSNLYTDTKINELINGAPETLNTLKEISDAIAEHQDVTDALNEAIGSKASQAELDAHTSNTTIHVTATDKTNWNDANTKKHTHSNQTVLDATTAAYTTTEKEKLAGITDGADSVSFTQSLTSGTQVGTITINGVDTKLYAPTKTTYGLATSTEDGLMPYEDKTKLDNTNITLGTCSTVASTPTKVVSISGNTNWTLQEGSVIHICFSTSNTATTPKLNVNGTGAKSIYVNGVVASGTSYKEYGGVAGCINTYIYNGTYYVYLGSSSIVDTKVTQTVTTTNAEYPLLATATSGATISTTTTARFASGVTLNPSTDSLTLTDGTDSSTLSPSNLILANPYDATYDEGWRNTLSASGLQQIKLGASSSTIWNALGSSIRLLGNNLADFVVAEGVDTTDGWTWRKWYSGKAECWCRREVSLSIDNWTGWGSGYLNDQITPIQYPFDFIAPPVELVNAYDIHTTYALSTVISSHDGNTKSVSGAYKVLRNTTPSITFSVAVNYYVVGNY